MTPKEKLELASECSGYDLMDDGMNKSLIDAAREAGFDAYEDHCLSGKSDLDRTLAIGEYPCGEAVFKLAAIIRRQERERCAKVCEEVERKATMQPPMVGQGCQACALAIRAMEDE